MYGVTGEKRPIFVESDAFLYNLCDPAILVSTKFHYFEIVPPASPYIIIPPGGIIIHEITGGNILKQRNIVDPNYT